MADKAVATVILVIMVTLVHVVPITYAGVLGLTLLNFEEQLLRAVLGLSTTDMVIERVVTATKRYATGHAKAMAFMTEEGCAIITPIEVDERTHKILDISMQLPSNCSRPMTYTVNKHIP